MGAADDFLARGWAVGFKLRIGDALLLSLLMHGLLVSVDGGQWRLDAAAGNSRLLTVMLPNRLTTATASPVQAPASHADHSAPARSPSADMVAAPPPQPRGLPFGEWYYPARYLHARPTPMRPIEPIYPANRESVAGRIVLLLFIGKTGAVDNYRIIESDPPGDFDSSAIEAFLAARFFPGKIAGRPVRSQIKVEIRYLPNAAPQATIIESPT